MRRVLTPFVLAAFAVIVFAPSKSLAIPAFSRQYQTSCSTCHLDFPKLNDFGKAFKDAGFKFPKDDQAFLKVPPVMLGAPAQKQMWPNVIWPGTIPGMPPIGLRMNNFFQASSTNANRFSQLQPAGTPPGTVGGFPFVPRTDFESGFFSIFTAGNFGSDIAFWVDDDISVSGDNSAGGLGDGYLKFVNLSRFLKLPDNAIALRAGRFELDLPFTQARSINISPYDIYSEANIGAMNSLIPMQQFVNNQFGLANVANGAEVSGGHLYGGYHYSVAVVNQNTSAISQSANTSMFFPSATGGANGGVGFASDANFKDIYSRFSYRINLERDSASRNAVQAAGATGPRDHTYINFGTFYYYGRSVQRLSGVLSNGTTPAVITGREPFYRLGGDFSFNYRTFNLFGLYMYGHDRNLLPIDAAGNLIVLPITSSSALPAGFLSARSATFDGGFVQADFLVHPWIMLIGRWDAVNSSADRINGLALAQNTSFPVPFHSMRNRYTPGVQFLIHANIKASFEYQIRPQQSVTFVTGAGGLPVALAPFRSNAATAALEFVY
ncbi:MAG: hypothetical protein JO041_05220 [Acidobacteria bacterium]|nr:hypothetical protein [Acidobacteriota bacterium]